MTETSRPVRILFVCLGNICRSPLAEGFFRHFVREAGVPSRFRIESAGTGNWHEGEPPDRRALEVARRHGIALVGRARQLTAADLQLFDYVIAMDADNLADILSLSEAVRPDARVHRLREFDPEAGEDLDVPDPYYGGTRGFETVCDIIERSCRRLLEHIRAEWGV